MKTLIFLFFSSYFSLMLSGCSSQPSSTSSQTPSSHASERISKHTPEIAVRPFTVETFYALLVAEVAGNRNRFDIALANYIQQAHKTRDSKVTARATHIGQYLKAHKATLDTAQLWLELEPHNNEARLIVATELSYSGRLQEAFDQSVILLNNGSTTLFQNIAARAANATDIQREQLLQAYLELQPQHPQYPQLLVSIGLLQQQQQQYNDALSSAQSALKNQPDFIPAAILEAKLLNQLNRPVDALKRLDSMLEQYPDNKRLRLQYARLLSAYDLELAYEQFSILVQQSPEDANLRLSLALICTERGYITEAKQHFNHLILQNQRRSTAHFYLGRIAVGEHLDDDALDHYLRVEPGNDYLPAQLQISNILVGRNNYRQARIQLQQARQDAPEMSERLYLIEAEVLKQYRQFHRAEKALSQGLKQHPLNSKLLYSRAMLYQSNQRFKKAEIDLRTLIKYDPENAAALNALGYTLADNTDRLEEALDLIQQALNITPNDPAIIDSMGWIQYRLGHYEAAVLRLRQAMTSYPDPEIAAHLGEVLWVMGETEEAHKIWQQGLTLDPDNKIISETMKRLTKPEQPGTHTGSNP